jgi:hypothetical protein
MQHRVVLDAERDHNGRIFRSLALVDGRRIRRHELIKFAEAVDDVPAVGPSSQGEARGFYIASGTSRGLERVLVLSAWAHECTWLTPRAVATHKG